jgi:signal transduction histidine kinase
LSVTDDGPGIPVSIQPRLFDPFFTTKSTGTGLGLSIVGRLVENQGGEIVFQTAPRAGTRFSVRLPIVAAGVHLGRS